MQRYTFYIHFPTPPTEKRTRPATNVSFPTIGTPFAVVLLKKIITNKNDKTMKKTIVVYGSTTGTCQEVAEQIAQKLGVSDVKNISDVDADMLADYDNLILGTSTWGAGELQDDWYDGVEMLKGADLSGKTIAIFGVGDAEGYSDTFCGGMSSIYEAVKDSGARLIGQVDASTYTYDDSESVVDGKFVGLAIDSSESEGKTENRVDAWLDGIKGEL